MTPDIALAAEFLACPLGHHSPALQALSRRMRTLPVPGKPAPLRVDHRRAWVIVIFNGVKGQPLTRVSDRVYTDWSDVEWAVFRLRWEPFRHFVHRAGALHISLFHRDRARRD
jgi:hypothetical protein